MSITWFLLLFNLKRRPERSVVIWAINLTFGWMLAVILLFHWIDERKTYAPMVKSIMLQLDAEHDCIITQVGPAQRGLIQYFGEIEQILKRYVKFYNTRRLHGLMGRITPMDKWNEDKHLILMKILTA